MESASLVKVVAAFVAGVIVSLGSALVYVRVNDSVHAQSAPMIQTISPDSPALPLPASDSPASASTRPEPNTSKVVVQQPPPVAAAPPAVIAPKKSKPTVETHRLMFIRVPRTASSRLSGVQLAQNRLPVSSPVVRPVDYPVPQQPPAPDPAPDQSQLSVPPSPEPVGPQPHVVTLQAGTNFAVRLAESLSSDGNYTGDTFRGTLEAPVVQDGFIIADRGSKVLGRIVNAQKAGRVHGLSGLSLTLTEINTTDGQRIHIETNSYDKAGQAGNGENAATIAGGAAIGAIIGAIAGGGKGAAIGAGVGGAAGTGAVLVTRGKPAVLAIETRLAFRLAEPITVTEKFN